jgi:hypothetical protein
MIPTMQFEEAVAKNTYKTQRELIKTMPKKRTNVQENTEWLRKADKSVLRVVNNYDFHVEMVDTQTFQTFYVLKKELMSRSYEHLPNGHNPRAKRSLKTRSRKAAELKN